MSFTGDQILGVWRGCQDKQDPPSPGDPPISTFAFMLKPVSEIDLDGYWFRERDMPRQQVNVMPPRHNFPRVVFPGQPSPIDPSSRPAFFFRNSLFRRTASTCCFADLDNAFSEIAPCSFLAQGSEADTKLIVSRASCLLSRLPTTPLPLPDLPKPPQDRGKHGWLKIEGDEYLWEDLEPVRLLSTCVIRMALAIAATWDRSREQNMRGRESHKFREFLDFLSELIDSTSYESRKLRPELEFQSWRWFVVRSYLWSTWQRCVALHYW